MSDLADLKRQLTCDANVHGLGRCEKEIAVVCCDANGVEWFACGDHAGFSTVALAPIAVTRLEDWLGEQGRLEPKEQAAFELEKKARKRGELRTAAMSEHARREGENQLERLGRSLEGWE